MIRHLRWYAAGALAFMIAAVSPAYAAESEPLRFTLEESTKGEGYVWEAETATLKMHNFSFACDGDSSESGCILEFDTGDTPVTIELRGKNVLENTAAADEEPIDGSIYAKKLRITGDGVLTMRSETSLSLTDAGSSVTVDGGAQVYTHLLRAENINILGEKTLVRVPPAGGVEAVNILTIDGGSLCTSRIGAQGGIRAYGIPRDGSSPTFQPMILKNVYVRRGFAVQTAQYTCKLGIPEINGRTYFGSMISKSQAYVQNNLLMSDDYRKYDTDYFEIVPYGAMLPTDAAGHWAYERIVALTVPGRLGGYADRTFRPEKKVTRAEFAKMIFAAGDKLDGVVSESDADAFPDLEGNWARKMINGLAEAQVIDKSDYPDGFRPDSNVTRAEAVKMLVRKLGYTVDNPDGTDSKESTDGAESADSKESTDDAESADSKESTDDAESVDGKESTDGAERADGIANAEAKALPTYPDINDPDTQFYAGKATELGVADGNTDGTFAPDKVLTRAEAAAFLYNALYR